MTIEVGARFQRYEIQSLLGQGGMGKVFRALDIELTRPVALKFLPAELALNERRLKRFVQEARAASALNHPNIITVYDIGRASDAPASPPFMATEFVDGVTLREYIGRSKLSVGEILDFGIQICSALAAAHSAGIVHRDIKPENIMVRHDHIIKILDFGLAKQLERPSSVDSQAETRAFATTDPGSIMGTVGYMSPEQARGDDIDARTDIWSTGVVLYEIIAGQPPFSGKTPAHVIVSILENEPPPLSTYVDDVPEALELIIFEALAKDRDERTQTAKEMLGRLRRLKQRFDAGIELERSVAPALSTYSGGRAPSTVNSGGKVSTVAVGKSTAGSSDFAERPAAFSSAEYIVTQIKQHKLGTIIGIVLGLLLLSGAAFGIYNYFDRSRNQAVVTPLKISRLTNNGKASRAAVSPDGRYIAFALGDGDEQSLVLRQTTTSNTRELVGPIKGYFLASTFSPDGNYIYYVQGGARKGLQELYQISVLGGDPRKLIFDIDSPVTFSPDGRKMAFLRVSQTEKRSAIMVANNDGTGEELLFARQDPDHIQHLAWSPDGERIAFNLYGVDQDGYFANVNEVRVSDHTERTISKDRWRMVGALAWLPDGSGLITYGRDRTSAPGAPMQIWQIEYPNGTTRRITSDLNNYSSLSMSADARTLVADSTMWHSNVWLVPVSGVNARQLTTNNDSGANGIAWTNDGRIVYSALEGENYDLWVMEADGSRQRQLTLSSAVDDLPSASPDGEYIVFESNRGKGWGLWRMKADGADPVELVSNIGRSFPVVSADSRWVYYSNDTGGKSVWKVPIEGGTPSRVSPDTAMGHTLSRDGKNIAYFRRDTDLRAPLQIEVLSLIDGTVVSKMDVDESIDYIRWAPDNRSLTYLNTIDGVSNIWSLPIDGQNPKQLTNWNLGRLLMFEWSPDGKQVAVAKGQPTSDLVLIEDFH